METVFLHGFLRHMFWGDFGHINHPAHPVVGMIYGAAFSWNGEEIPRDGINRQISMLEYRDGSRRVGVFMREDGSRRAGVFRQRDGRFGTERTGSRKDAGRRGNRKGKGAGIRA